MPTMTATIEEVEVLKRGKSDQGKAWTLYAVHAGGKKLTTFDQGWVDKKGQTAEIEYEVVDKGKFVDYRISPPKPKQGNSDQGEVGIKQVWAELLDTNDLLREILKVLRDQS